MLVDQSPEDNCTQVQIDKQTEDPLAELHLSANVERYARKALSDNTWSAYDYDLAHYYDWGGIIPASPDMIASYIASFAGELAVSTLNRRLAAINKAHEMQGHPSPTKNEAVRLVMRGIRREHSTIQKQAAPLLRDDLIQILNHMGDDAKSIRDTAILMLGFACALRRSEITALNVEDIEFVTEGAIITIRKSKTDQDGRGRRISIPKGRGRYCPVQKVQFFLKHIQKTEGALFTSIRKGGHIQDARLSHNAISNIVKDYAEKIGHEPANYSGHSLRAGFVTSAAMLGIPEWQIMKQSGHKSHATMMRYVRDARLFEDHPLEAML
ncbi:MAG: site-specific integrase [Alphaproteobacteria bacterium]